MVKTQLTREGFELLLEELRGEFSGGLISAETLKTKVDYIKEHCAADLGGLTDGLSTGKFDHPVGWYRALQHLYEADQIEFAPDGRPDPKTPATSPSASVAGGGGRRRLDKSLMTSFSREEFDQLMALAESRLAFGASTKGSLYLENQHLSMLKYSTDFDDFLHDFRKSLMALSSLREEPSEVSPMDAWRSQKLCAKLEALKEADRRKLIWCGKESAILSSAGVAKLVVGSLSMLASLSAIATTFFGQNVVSSRFSAGHLVSSSSAGWLVAGLLISALLIPQGVRAFSERLGDTARIVCWALFGFSVLYAFRWPHLLNGSTWGIEEVLARRDGPTPWLVMRVYLAMLFCFSGIDLPIRLKFRSFVVLSILGLSSAVACVRLFLSELAAASVDTTSINVAEDAALISMPLLVTWILGRAYNGSFLHAFWRLDASGTVREVWQARSAMKRKAKLGTAIKNLERAKADPRYGKEATGLRAWLSWLTINLSLLVLIPELWRSLTGEAAAGAYNFWKNRTPGEAFETHIFEYAACVLIVLLAQWLFVRVFTREHLVWLILGVPIAGLYFLIGLIGTGLLGQTDGTTWESAARIVCMVADLACLLAAAGLLLVGPYLIEMLYLWPEVRVKTLE